jgi:carboxylesterase type B
MPTLDLLDAHRGRSFGYEFSWQSPALPAGFGANHALEIPFVRDGLQAFREVGPAAQAVLGADAPRELATLMHAAWVRFATDGDPGWRRYDRATRTTMRFDTTSQPLDDPAGAERELWDGLG